MAYLYVFHQGIDNNGQLWFSRNDHMNWSEDTPIPNLTMSGSPSQSLGPVILQSSTRGPVTDSFRTRISMAQPGEKIRWFRT
jgi:hypothetical protein